MSVVVIASKTGTPSYTVYSYDRMTAVIAFLAFFALDARRRQEGRQVGRRPDGDVRLLPVLLLPAAAARPLADRRRCHHRDNRARADGLAHLRTDAASTRRRHRLIWRVSAGIAAEVFGRMAHLSGYNVPNIESLLFISQNSKIDVGELLFAGILASLGAVLDIAMDVSAATAEIRSQSAEVSAQSLFKSGMRVGQDVMGTMAATLILAVRRQPRHLGVRSCSRPADALQLAELQQFLDTAHHRLIGRHRTPRPCSSPPASRPSCSAVTVISRQTSQNKQRHLRPDTASHKRRASL